MQATLLAVSIAIILALVAALAGPHFVDWSQYRSVFESEATRLTGMPVRITGAIDARILPTPSLMLRGIEAGPAGDPGRLKARELAIEFRLGPLLRGQWRAAEMRLVGPEIRLGTDAGGRIDWPAAAAAIDLESLSIEGLAIEDGRAVLSDAGGGGRLVLDKLWFNGEVRSLLGPVKGEGGFLVDEERYGYRLSAGRHADDQAMRLRLNIDPADRPLSVEAEGAVRVDRGAPRFDGVLTLARARVSRGGDAAVVPWRVVGKVKASAANALFEQVDLQYGPDEHPLKLSGVVDVKFGRKPRFDGVLSARQIDLDSVLDLPEPARRLPLAAIRSLVEGFGGAGLPIPGLLGISVDTLNLAGGQVQAVRGDLAADPAGWDLERLEFRAPGSAQVRVSGRLGYAAEHVTFAGPAALDASDAKTFLAWLEGRQDGVRRQLGVLHLGGDVRLEPGRIAIERLKAEVDRQAVTGRLSYAFAGARPTRLEADLVAAELDVDAALAVARAASLGDAIAWPSELQLAIEAGEVIMAGVSARKASIRLRSDPGRVVLDKLSVGDLGGAAFDLGGEIERIDTSPRGRMTLDLDARGFDGVLALLARWAPQAAETMRPVLGRLAGAKAHATLSVEAGPPSASLVKLAVEGTAGPVRLAMTGEATGDPWTPASLALVLGAQAASDDGRVLIALLGLDRAVAVEKAPAMLGLTARGRADDDLRVDTRLAAGGLAVTGGGKLRLAGDGGPTAGLDLTASAANLTLLRSEALPQAVLPVTLKARLNVAGTTLSFEGLSGTVAGTPLRGRLGVALGARPRLDGRLEADAIDAANVMASALGMPARKAASGDAPGWSTEPFGRGVLDGIDGRIEFAVPRATITPGLVARSLRGVLRFGDREIAFEDLDGQVGGGKAQAQLTFTRLAEGVSAHLRIGLVDADVAALVRGGPRPPVTGKLSIQLEGDGNGLTPAALVGSLSGSGAVTLDGGQFAALDPKVFAAVTRGVDQGLTIDPAKVGALVSTALDGGDLRVARADGALTVTSGQMRLANVIASGAGADLTITGSLDLAEGVLDSRLILSGPAERDGTGLARPDVFIGIKGPVGSAKRAIDVSALAGWLMLRAVDRETRRIEAIEAERRESALGPTQPPAQPSAPEAPGAPPPAPAPPSAAAPAPATPGPPAAAPPPQPAPVVRPERRARPEPSVVAPGDHAPALPPPIEIRPIPTPGTTPRAHRAGSPAAPTRQAPSPPMPVPDPPRGRSFLDSLIGPQR